MKKLLDRVQKELHTLQNTLQKEGNDLLVRFKKLDFVDNLESKKKEITKIVEKNIKKFEPAYRNFLDEVNKNVKKAGINLEKIERELMKKVGLSTKKVASTRKKVKTKINSVKKKLGKKTATMKTVKKKTAKKSTK